VARWCRPADPSAPEGWFQMREDDPTPREPGGGHFSPWKDHC
jgi:hypothetical protein